MAALFEQFARVVIAMSLVFSFFGDIVYFYTAFLKLLLPRKTYLKYENYCNILDMKTKYSNKSCQTRQNFATDNVLVHRCAYSVLLLYFRIMSDFEFKNHTAACINQ